jgi:hypothetical protein
MAISEKHNRTVNQVAIQDLIAGFKKHDQTITSMFIKGTSMSTASIIAALQTLVDSSSNVVLTRAAWLHAVEVDRDLRAKTRALVTGVRQGLQVAFSDDISTLADYGLKPRQPRVLTPQQKVEATAKAKATRAARHTMGSKQKAQIKGTVEVPATAPTAPPPVATAPSPASPPAATPVVAPPAAPVVVTAPKPVG